MAQDNQNKNLPAQGEVQDVQPSGLKKRALWTIVFIAIAALTIWAITSQNKGFSLTSFREFIRGLNPLWVIAAFLSVILYILFEAIAILTLCRSLGYRRSFKKGISYSSADIYFSAITPSSTGGQPASAYLMMKDGIPGSFVTAILMINLIMYTFSILILGIFAFLFCPNVFMLFALPSRVLILVGIGTQVGLALAFLLLLKKPSILRWIGAKLLWLLGKLHILRHIDKKLLRFNRAIDSYENCVNSLGKRRRALAKALFFNFLQRAALIAVSVFSYLAAGGTIAGLPDFCTAECMAILGYSFIPIPGAMGVADGLLLNIFTALFGDVAYATNLELLSRSISFYLCVILCGVIFLIRCIRIARRGRYKKKTPSAKEPVSRVEASLEDEASQKDTQQENNKVTDRECPPTIDR